MLHHCYLLDRAIFSPTSVQTGVVRAILAKSALTAMTLPPVDNDPMLTINTSLLANFWTLAAFLSPSVLTPSRRLGYGVIIELIKLQGVMEIGEEKGENRGSEIGESRVATAYDYYSPEQVV